MEDKIYLDTKFVNQRDVGGTYKEKHRMCRARHEKDNSRLKKINVLYDTFLHDEKKHDICFHAVAQLVSLMLKTTDLLFKW